MSLVLDPTAMNEAELVLATEPGVAAERRGCRHVCVFPSDESGISQTILQRGLGVKDVLTDCFGPDCARDYNRKSAATVRLRKGVERYLSSFHWNVAAAPEPWSVRDEGRLPKAVEE
jgi:hypothetical protein